MIIKPTQSQHEGGVSNGHVNFTNCSIPHSSVLHGGMLCTAVIVTPLAKSKFQPYIYVCCSHAGLHIMLH